MRSTFWVDIEDATGVVLGVIKSAVEWRQVRRLSRAGNFSFRMPAGDPAAALVQRKRVARCYTIIAGAVAEVGAGVIDHLSFRDQGAERVLSVSGDDLLRELTVLTVGKLCLGGYRLATTGSLQQIKQKAFPAGWSFDTLSPHSYNTTAMEVYRQMNYETALAALAKVADLTGEFFILGEGRQVRWLRKETLDAPFYATQVRAAWATPDSNVAAITELSYDNDSYDQATRCYAVGGSFSATNRDPDGNPWQTISGVITLADAYGEYARGALTLPPGFTMEYDLDETLTNRYYIKHQATEDVVGRIDRFQSWADIKPIDGFSANEIMICSKQLALAACEWLGQRINGQTSVTVGLAGAQGQLLPGSLLRVLYRAVTDGVAELDLWGTNLLVLEATTLIDQTGLHTVEARAVDYGRWPRTNDELFADLVDRMRYMGVIGGVSEAMFQQALDEGMATHVLSFRGNDGVPVFRFEANPVTGVEYGVIGHPTQPRIEWTANVGITIAGSAIAPVLRASASWYPGDIDSMTAQATDVEVVGVEPGDTILAAHDMMPRNSLIISALCWQANEVRALIFNAEGGKVNVGDGTLHLTIFKRP